MSVGDCYAIKLFQEYLGQLCLNVWTYEQMGGSANQAGTLRTAFTAGVLDDISALQNAGVVYTDLEVFNIEFGSDYANGAPTVAGGSRAAVDVMPSLAAMGFVSNRAGFGSRRSFKRFTGLLEADHNSNYWNAGALALGQAVADAMEIDLISGLNIWRPVQLRSGWSPGVIPTRNFFITTWVPEDRVTTQNSRKPRD